MRININKRTLKRVTAKHMPINFPKKQEEIQAEPIVNETEPEAIETTTMEVPPVVEIEETPVVVEEEKVEPEPKKKGKKSKKTATTEPKEEDNKQE